MLFTSFIFIFVFLPIVFSTYFFLNKIKLTKASKVFLVFSSLFFYGYWNIIYIPLILASMLFNYGIGQILLGSTVTKRVNLKLILTVGIIANVGLLGYYKYADFFIANINLLFDANMPLLQLMLPLAISFFTFQQIAYLVDCYRKEIHQNNVVDYALFVSFFPQLIAGPIVHHKGVMPQFANIRNQVINYKNIATGIFIFSIGLFKKVVIADTFAYWANDGYAATRALDFFEAWVVSISFYFQLYFDFSGYMDMAIGLALLFNIRLPINFNSPYRATSLIDFWNRWHITLSTFVNMYIFKPIIGSFKKYSFSKGMLAMFISMFIIGIWHGASWLFVLFGLLHGSAVVFNHIWKKKIKIKIHKFIGWFLTFNIVNFSMILFRADDWSDVVRVAGGMIDLSSFEVPKLNSLFDMAYYTVLLDNPEGPMYSSQIFIGIIVAFLIIFYVENSNNIIKNFQYKWYQSLLVVVNLVTSFFFSIHFIDSPFLYFNF